MKRQRNHYGIPITAAGTRVWPVWFVMLFGGTFKSNGYSWCPSIWRRTYLWVRQGWWRHRSWHEFVWSIYR